VERSHQLLLEKIKAEVMAEMGRRRSSESYYSGGYQAYCQLVDAVREEVLDELKRSDHYGWSYQEPRRLVEAVKHDVLRQLESRPEWSHRPYHSGAYDYAGGAGQPMTPEEFRMIKDEVIHDLQLNPEGHAERAVER
jgi:hypothetical protein